MENLDGSLINSLKVSRTRYTVLVHHTHGAIISRCYYLRPQLLVAQTRPVLVRTQRHTPTTAGLAVPHLILINVICGIAGGDCYGSTHMSDKGGALPWA